MISVCMATFNGEKYLREQIQSILDQTHPVDEIVISDNGSTDGTLAVIRSFSDSRIKLLSCERRGVVPNFESALTASKGDFIFLSDQDDVWLPNKVAECMKEFETGAVSVLSNAELIFQDGKTQNRTLFGEKKPRVSTTSTFIRNSYTGCCMAVRREVLERALPFPSNLPMHDSWLGLVGTMLGTTNVVTKQLIQHRRHTTNSSSTSGESAHSFGKKLDQRLILLTSLITRFKAHTGLVLLALLLWFFFPALSLMVLIPWYVRNKSKLAFSLIVFSLGLINSTKIPQSDLLTYMDWAVFYPQIDNLKAAFEVKPEFLFYSLTSFIYVATGALKLIPFFTTVAIYLLAILGWQRSFGGHLSYMFRLFSFLVLVGVGLPFADSAHFIRQYLGMALLLLVLSGFSPASIVVSFCIHFVNLLYLPLEIFLKLAKAKAVRVALVILVVVGSIAGGEILLKLASSVSGLLPVPYFKLIFDRYLAAHSLGETTWSQWGLILSIVSLLVGARGWILDQKDRLALWLFILGGFTLSMRESYFFVERFTLYFELFLSYFLLRKSATFGPFFKRPAFTLLATGITGYLIFANLQLSSWTYYRSERSLLTVSVLEFAHFDSLKDPRRGKLDREVEIGEWQPCWPKGCAK